MVFSQSDVGSFTMSSMPGGFVERQVNTSHPRSPKNTILTETKDQGLPNSKRQGAYYQSPQKAFVWKALLPGVLYYRLSLRKELHFWVSSRLKSQPGNPAAGWLRPPEFQLPHLRSFPSRFDQSHSKTSGMTSLLRGQALNSTETLVILENMNEEKRLHRFYICAKGTLTERRSIWKLSH